MKHKFKRRDSESASDRDRLLRVAEVADAFGISVRQVWKLCSTGLLPSPIKLGGSTRWRASDVSRVIENGPQGDASGS